MEFLYRSADRIKKNTAEFLPQILGMELRFLLAKIFLIFVIAAFFADNVFNVAFAAFNEKINYQGKLMDSSNAVVTDGAYDVVFKFYDAAGGGSTIWTESWTNAALWSEASITFTDDGCAVGVDKIAYTTQTNESTLAAGQSLWNTTRKDSAVIQSVDTTNNWACVYDVPSAWATTDGATNRIYVKNGLFSVMLGSVSSLSSINFNQTLYLGVTIGADSEMKPRKIIGAVPAAFEAKQLGGKTWAAPDAIGSGTPAGGAFTTLSSTGLTTVGNNSATVAIDSSDWDINTLGAMTGISGITSDSTYTQTAGNFAMSGTGTFGTGTGAISLNGATSVTGTNTFTVGTGLTTLGGNLTVTGTAWTATPTISGLITATSGFDSNAASTVAGLTVDTNGDLVISNGTLSVTAPSTTGNAGAIVANSLTTGTGLDISSTSTAGGASGVSKLLNLSRSGANSNTAHTAYGIYSSVTNTNATSGTNIAGYFSASGATTANYGLIVESGNVGIGTTAPKTADSLARTIQIGDNFIMQNTVGSQVSLGQNAYYDGSLWKRAVADTAQAIRMYSGDIIFHLASTGVAGSTITNWDGSDRKMIIKGDTGNIGIGDISPLAMLTVGSGDPFQVNSSGQIAAVAGYTQGSGNFAISGTGTFGTGTGAISLNGSVTIASGKSLTMTSGTGVITQTYTGTASALTITASTTTGNAGAIVANSLTTGTGLNISSTSTAGTGSNSSKLINLARSGANSNASHTAYGLYSAVTNTGTTSTNVGGYFSASGATNNYGLVVANGNVGIGATAPTQPLEIQKNQNAATRVNILNSTSGTGAYEWLRLGQDDAGSTVFDIFHLNSSFTAVGAYRANASIIDALDTGGLILTARDAGGVIKFLTAGVNDSNERMRITSGGNVGLGTASPESKVQISGGGLCVGSDANCNTDNNTEGIVYSSATAMTLYDVAENYPSKDATLEPAEVVTLDNFQNGPFVKRGNMGEALLGVVSTAPSVLLGGFNGQEYKEDHQVAIALSGRVPVKISLENGPIKTGDYLTSSSTPGVAMRADKAGRVIGMALENFDGSDLGKDKVTVFVNPHWYGGTLAENGNLVNSNGDEIIASLGNNPGFVELVKSTVKDVLASLSGTVTAAGEWTFEKITAKKFCVEDVCVDRDQLKNLLQKTQEQGNINLSSAPQATLSPSVAPEANLAITPSPIPSVVPEISPEPVSISNQGTDSILDQESQENSNDISSPESASSAVSATDYGENQATTESNSGAVVEMADEAAPNPSILPSDSNGESSVLNSADSSSMQNLSNGVDAESNTNIVP